MSTYMAAASREGKKLNDVVFSSSAAAKEAIKKYGIEHVVNATVGCYAGDDEKVACLPVVEKVYKSLPMRRQSGWPITAAMSSMRPLKTSVPMAMRLLLPQLAVPGPCILPSATIPK